jgi:hypothetical protein
MSLVMYSSLLLGPEELLTGVKGTRDNWFLVREGVTVQMSLPRIRFIASRVIAFEWPLQGKRQVKIKYKKSCTQSAYMSIYIINGVLRKHVRLCI